MPFKKQDEKINRNGRPKGTPNKSTAEVKAWIMEILENNKTTFEKNIKSLDPEKHVLLIEKLLNYVLPKASTIEVNDTTPRPFQITVVDKQTSDELQKLFDEMEAPEAPEAFKLEVSSQQTAEKLARWMEGDAPKQETPPIRPLTIPNPKFGFRKTHI